MHIFRDVLARRCSLYNKDQLTRYPQENNKVTETVLIHIYKDMSNHPIRMPPSFLLGAFFAYGAPSTEFQKMCWMTAWLSRFFALLRIITLVTHYKLSPNIMKIPSVILDFFRTSGSLYHFVIWCVINTNIYCICGSQLWLRYSFKGLVFYCNRPRGVEIRKFLLLY